MTCSRPSTRNRRTQRAATVRMSIICTRTRTRTRPQKPKHLVDPTVSCAHSAASGGTLCLSCLQHAKPQSQHVQHFLVFPFQSPFCCHFNAANGQTTVKLTWLTSLTHTISLSLPLSLTHSLLLLLFCRYGRWVTRRVAVITIAAIWLLAAFVSFVPISLGIHRPDQPLIFEDNGKKYPTCALDLTPTYAVVSSCISFYFPCVVMIGIYCR